MTSYFGDTLVVPGLAFCLSPSAIRRWTDVSEVPGPGSLVLLLRDGAQSIYRKKSEGLFAFGPTKHLGWPQASPVYPQHARVSLSGL